MSGRVSVPCWHATPIANAIWKPVIIGEGQTRYQGHEIGGKSDWLGSHCWSRIRMSFNIRERDTSYCRIRSPYRPLNFLNDDFKRSARYPCLKLTCRHINRRHFCFNIKSISVDPLLWMNVMLDFICMVFAGM